MLNSFKNFERLRYRIAVDIKQSLSDIQNEKNKSEDIISNTVFATLFTIFITDIAFEKVGNNYNWYKVVGLILLFIVLYILSFYVYGKLSPKVRKLYNEVRINKVNDTYDNMIKIQKDFDNIACDSILVANDYRDAFELLLVHDNENRTLLFFYYYELMHYLWSACEKTRLLVRHKEYCIKTIDKAIGVDLYRVKNINNMMNELIIFLEQNYIIVECNNDEKEIIKSQIDEIKKDISWISEKI